MVNYKVSMVSIDVYQSGTLNFQFRKKKQLTKSTTVTFLHLNE